MKAINILFRPYGRPIIDPLKLKLQITTPIKKVAEEIGIVRLLEVILMVSTIVGLLVFLGVKLLQLYPSIQ